MQHDSQFTVRYLTDEPVPIRDIIESLYGIETVLGETSRLLPKFIDGLKVEGITIKVREIAQESPLREIFLVSLFLAFQDELESEVIGNIERLGLDIPSSLDTTITIVALIVVFYGAGTIRDLVMGKAAPGPAQRQLDGLIAELARDTGKSEAAIRATLDNRYREPSMTKRLANAASRFFTPSKRLDSAPVQVNDRHIDQETMRDVPAQYLIDHESETKPSRNFLRRRSRASRAGQGPCGARLGRRHSGRYRQAHPPEAYGRGQPDRPLEPRPGSGRCNCDI